MPGVTGRKRRNIWWYGAWRRSALACALTVLCVGTSAAAAPAAVTIGQTATPAGVCSTGIDYLQPMVSSETPYVVPTDGTITSWSHLANANAGLTLTMKVFRPVLGTTTYTVVGHDSRMLEKPSELNTFTVSIPVHAGDVLGLFSTSNNTGCTFNAPTGEPFLQRSGNLADGESGQFDTGSNIRLNISAVVEPTPVVEPPKATPPGTGQRDAALKNCKKKKSKKARRKCKKRALLLPV